MRKISTPFGTFIRSRYCPSSDDEHKLLSRGTCLAFSYRRTGDRDRTDCDLGGHGRAMATPTPTKELSKLMSHLGPGRERRLYVSSIWESLCFDEHGVVMIACGGSLRWQWCQVECHSGQQKHIFAA